MSSIPEDRPRSIQPAATGAVQLVQVTDCHVFATAAERLHGFDTRRSFESVLNAAIGDRGPLDLLLATGDLSQDGSAESYVYLARQFESAGIPTFWLPGNHDEPGVMESHFSGERIHADNRILTGAWQIVMLDSTVFGEVHGRLPDEQLDFMDASLRQYPGHHALVCLHHQAVHAGSEWIDQKGLKGSDRLRQRMLCHENLRAVLWGHVHQEVHHRINGVEWMSTPSTCVQFEPGSIEFAVGKQAPGYRHLSLNADGSIETAVFRVAPTD